MQPLLSKDPTLLAEENHSVHSSLWNQAGPFLLLSAFTILIFKYAPFFLLLLLTSIGGYTANLLWKKRGFYFSLMGLAGVSIYTIRSGVDPFWPSLFSASVALSWLLIFLGKQESETFFSNQEEKIKILKENQRLLERQLREAKASLSEENKENISERERLNHLYSQAMMDLSQAKRSLEISEKEREKLNEGWQLLSQDIFVYKRKEIAFQHALEDAQSQLLKFKNQQESKALPTKIVAEEELEHVQLQYALLREQFEEKSEALDQVRKDLFRAETELLALQKVREEKVLEIPEEEKCLEQDLKRMEEECADFEIQIQALQEVICALLSPKKRLARSKKSLENQQGLPFLIQEKIDQNLSFEFLPSDLKNS